MAANASKITQSLLNAINTRLSENGKPSWVGVLEAFVGLLRNVHKASADDVKIYMQDHKRLTAKLSKMVHVAHTLRLSHVEDHLEFLKSQSGLYKSTNVQPKSGNMADGHIKPVLDWALAFAQFAQKVLRQSEI